MVNELVVQKENGKTPDSIHMHRPGIPRNVPNPGV